MKTNISNLLKIMSFALIGVITIISCESDPDHLGEQLFSDSALEGIRKNYDIVAYNKDNGNYIEADAMTLNTVRIGAFKENVFGMQKTAFLSQISLSSYAPTFGTNAEVDSVVLYMTPIYNSNSLAKTSSDFNYINTDGDTIAATQNLEIYPVVKYGNDSINATPSIFNIQVHEVTDFLKSVGDTIYSNETFAYGTLLGTKEFDGNINSIEILDKNDNSTLFKADKSLRIPLDASFFQTKIVAQQGTNNLKDFATFIRYFKGIRISVLENDGYLFGINPNSTTIKMYYKYDDNDGKRKPATYTMNLGSGNSHIGQYEYNTVGSTVAEVLSSTNSTDGDSKLYLQGMGGSSVMLKIPASVVATLRDKYENDKIGIIGGRIRLYTDESTWNNDYDKPENMVLLKDGAEDYLSEVKKLASASGYLPMRIYDLDKTLSYYDLTVTQTLKEAIEDSATNEDIILKLDIGSFLYNSSGALRGYQYTSKSYQPERVVFVGSDNTNDKKVQLQVTYAK